MRQNNKGLSLVEIIIVVAIMSALTGIMSIGLSSVVSKPAEECANKMVSVLRNAKITTMGKQSITIDVSQDSAGDKIMIAETITSANGSVKTDNFKVGNTGISVKFTTKSGAEYDLSTVDHLRLSFNRSTGGFNMAEFTVEGSSTAVTDYVKEIVVNKGKKTCSIKLAYLTGKVSIQ